MQARVQRLKKASLRFPTRTLILMILAVLAFCWMYWRTHFGAPQRPVVSAHAVEFISIEGGDR